MGPKDFHFEPPKSFFCGPQKCKPLGLLLWSTKVSFVVHKTFLLCLPKISLFCSQKTFILSLRIVSFVALKSFSKHFHFEPPKSFFCGPQKLKPLAVPKVFFLPAQNESVSGPGWDLPGDPAGSPPGSPGGTGRRPGDWGIPLKFPLGIPWGIL